MTDRVQQSAGECNAVVSALMECSRFCISRCLTSSTSDVDLTDFIVSHIVSRVKWCLFFSVYMFYKCKKRSSLKHGVRSQITHLKQQKSVCDLVQRILLLGLQYYAAYTTHKYEGI